MEEFMKHEMNHQLAVCYKVIRVMLVKVYIYMYFTSESYGTKV